MSFSCNKNHNYWKILISIESNYIWILVLCIVFVLDWFLRTWLKHHHLRKHRTFETNERHEFLYWKFEISIAISIGILIRWQMAFKWSTFIEQSFRCVFELTFNRIFNNFEWKMTRAKIFIIWLRTWTWTQ